MSWDSGTSNNYNYYYYTWEATTAATSCTYTYSPETVKWTNVKYCSPFENPVEKARQEALKDLEKDKKNSFNQKFRRRYRVMHVFKVYVVDAKEAEIIRSFETIAESENEALLEAELDKDELKRKKKGLIQVVVTDMGDFKAVEPVQVEMMKE